MMLQIFVRLVVRASGPKWLYRKALANDDNRSTQVRQAYELLYDATKRAAYDRMYFDVQDAWTLYKQQQETRRKEEERHAAQEEAEREKKAAEAERLRNIEEQKRLAKEKARLERMREEKVRQAEERSREAARRAWEDQQRAAKERLHREKKAEAERRSEEAARRRRAEQEEAAFERLRAAQLEERQAAARRVWTNLRDAGEHSSTQTRSSPSSPVKSAACAHPQFGWPKANMQANCAFCGVYRRKWAFICPECRLPACPACKNKFSVL
jgi:curved DNA-binding protein CbpA